MEILKPINLRNASDEIAQQVTVHLPRVYIETLNELRPEVNKRGLEIESLDAIFTEALRQAINTVRAQLMH